MMEVDGPDISKYGVVVPNGSGASIAGLIEKPDASEAPLNLASTGRYVLTPDIFNVTWFDRRIRGRNSTCRCDQHLRTKGISGNFTSERAAF